MRMLIRYERGIEVEAVLLAASREQMRVVISGQRDATELTRLEDGWRVESGQLVEIEALIPVAGTDCSDFCSDVYPQTMTAGRKFTV
jgi:hypothetical protein